MQLPPDNINGLIPEGLPAENLILAGTLELANSIEDLQLRRSYLWANAILVRLLSSPEYLGAPGILPIRTSHVSAGFVHLLELPLGLNSPSYKIVNKFAFGAYALAYSEDETKKQEVIPVNVGNSIFPLVLNYGRIQLHGCPTHPPGGTGCCWVQDATGTATWTHGILASRHVVSSYSLGSGISLTPTSSYSTPVSGSLADIDACTIDAAIIKINSADWPAGLGSLHLNAAIAPGVKVQFNGAHTSGSGSVLRIFQHSNYYGNLFGQRIITDCYGIPGDSGTLLQDTSGRGLGIYMGDIPDGSGGYEGLYQDLKQVEHYFHLNLYF